FWLNDGRGTFRAVPRLAVRNTSNSSMAVDFSDVDRDGNVDILVVDMLGRGPRRKSQIPTHTPLPKLIGQIDDRPQWQRNTLLWNRGDGTFAQIAGYAGIDASDWGGGGAVGGVLNRLGSPAAVVRNVASGPRVAVRLRGTPPNTAGAGSKIRLLGGPVPVQQKEVVLGGTYLSGSDPLYTFAAVKSQDLAIEVDWRRGGRSVVRGVKPNREYEIQEPPRPPGSGRPGQPARLTPGVSPVPWF